MGHPAAIWKLSYHAQEVVAQLNQNDFILDQNLIEVFTTFAKRIIKRLPKIPCLPAGRPANQNQYDAFICALIAAWHLEGKTFWIGYRDGRLWLPNFIYWKKEWRDRFLGWWHKKHPFKYKFLQISQFP